MDITGKIAVVTGAASGIGAALARRFAADGAAHVVCADRDIAGARRVAEEIGGTAIETDVARDADIVALVEQVERDTGPIDLFVSNAGIIMPGGIETSDADWNRIFDINVHAHIRAARAVVPRMIERGGGYILSTASAAGLLAQIGSAPYSVTKHAAVAFAEWLAITHGGDGIQVSVLCPQGVDTPLIADMDTSTVDTDGLLSTDEVARVTAEALAQNRFLILPHPKVADYMQRKATDPDRWIAGMQRWQAKLGGSARGS